MDLPDKNFRNVFMVIVFDVNFLDHGSYKKRVNQSLEDFKLTSNLLMIVQYCHVQYTLCDLCLRCGSILSVILHNHVSSSLFDRKGVHGIRP